MNSFIIDTSPTIRNDLDVPKYTVERKSQELIKHEEISTPQKPKSFQNFNPCWNCGRTNHSIRDCDFKSNPYALEWNKQIQIMTKNYQMKKFQKNAGRYHDADNKCSHIKPGSASSRLRRIMGISEYELPLYIYRLRSHGYPKAWLKYATVKSSGINLYDKDGNEVADPGAEEGEIMEEEDKIRYDLSKLIRFPGFNAPLPPNAVDNYKKFGALPFDPNQNLEHMIEDLKEKAVTEYVLKKNSNQSTASEDLKSTHVSMEIESLNESDNDSKSLSECFIPPVLSEKSSPILNETVQNLSESQEFLSISAEKSGLGRILSSAEGTPLLRSKSVHTKLPPRENFSKNICDVINFENLPESTGKFERLRGILKKVKNALGLQKKSS